MQAQHVTNTLQHPSHDLWNKRIHRIVYSTDWRSRDMTRCIWICNFSIDMHELHLGKEYKLWVVANGNGIFQPISSDVIHVVVGQGESLTLLTWSCSYPHATVSVDGGWSRWSFPGVCSVTCGRGVRISYRTCSNPVPANGGSPCRGPKHRTEICRISTRCRLI